MSPKNYAAWYKEKQAPKLTVDEAPYSPPGDNEVTVRVRAVAFNPVDGFLHKAGIMFGEYPAIFGNDAAGEVVEVGSKLHGTFKPGDRVIGFVWPYFHTDTTDGKFDPKYSAFQNYVVMTVPLIAKIPDSIEFAEAAVLPLGLSTALGCLFPEQYLGLVVPPSKVEKGNALVVWGASGSVGSCAVQLATASGYEVFAVASRKNHDMVESIGAVQCFDQNDSNVVEEMVSALKGKHVVGAFDAISKETTVPRLCEILAKSDGRRYVAGVLPGANKFASEGVQVDMVMADFVHTHPAGQAIWRQWLEGALASGQLKCKPDPEIVGHGLESIQLGIDTIQKGVSAKKVVVLLD